MTTDPSANQHQKKTVNLEYVDRLFHFMINMDLGQVRPLFGYLTLTEQCKTQADFETIDYQHPVSSECHVRAFIV